MNKRGQVGFMFMFFIFVAVLIVVAFFIAIISGVINMTTDQIFPEIRAIGTIGDTNVTAASGYVLDPLEGLINSFSWLGGMAYIIAIIGLFGIAFAHKITMNRMFIPIFLAFALLLILLSILMSNIYEDVYTGTDELSTELKNQTMLSWLILNSPMVFTIMIFASGIVLFSGINQEETV